MKWRPAPQGTTLSGVLEDNGSGGFNPLNGAVVQPVTR